MAVKAAIALAGLSAVEPTNKCLTGREEISKLGLSLERNSTEKVEGNTGHRAEVRDGKARQATGLSTAQRAPKSQTFGLALVCHLGGSTGSCFQNTASLSERGIKQKLKHRVSN